MDLPLLASIVALLVGPVVYAATRTRSAAAALDAFTLVAVCGLVLVHIVPQSFALAGWWVVPALVVGVLGPGLLCGSRLLAGRSAGRVTMPLALFGLALHAILDGVALSGETEEGHVLAVAVVLHRLPVGLGLWWLARPLYGQRAAAALLGAIAVFTVVGFYSGATLLEHAPQRLIALVQAVVAGSLLHVLLKHPPHPPSHSEHGTSSPGLHRLASGLGGLAGLALLFAVDTGWHLETHVFEHREGMDLFLELALRSAPALLVAYAVVALMHAWDFDLRSFLGRGSALQQALRGTVAGLPIPVCSCGVIPIYRSLVHRGVPTPAAMAFLIATPEVGIAALFLSISLLGGPITVLRVASAALLALGVGLVVGRNAPVLETFARPQDDEARPPLGTRLKGGLLYGFGDMVDGTAAWILVGLAVAALAGPLLDAGALAGLPPGLEVPLFALIGLPLYVCASGSTPLVAVLIAEGVSPGAAIAFLLTGPATNLTTFGVLGRLHGRRRALAFAGVTVLGTVALGLAVNAILPNASTLVPIREHEHGPSLLERVSLVLLALVFTVSFLRQGTRGFVGQVISPHGSDEHRDHDDHDDHAHHGAGAARTACCGTHAAAAPTPEEALR